MNRQESQVQEAEAAVAADVQRYFAQQAARCRNVLWGKAEVLFDVAKALHIMVAIGKAQAALEAQYGAAGLETLRRMRRLLHTIESAGRPRYVEEDAQQIREEGAYDWGREREAALEVREAAKGLWAALEAAKPASDVGAEAVGNLQGMLEDSDLDAWLDACQEAEMISGEEWKVP